MEKNTKILIGVAAAGVVAYLVYKSKKPKNEVQVSYPEGLKEGDFIRYSYTLGYGDAEKGYNIYKLVGGKKLPVTNEYAVKYAGDKWDGSLPFQVIIVSADSVKNIPIGETLK